MLSSRIRFLPVRLLLTGDRSLTQKQLGDFSPTKSVGFEMTDLSQTLFLHKLDSILHLVLLLIEVNNFR